MFRAVLQLLAAGSVVQPSALPPIDVCGSEACQHGDNSRFCFGTPRLGFVFCSRTLALLNLSSCSADGRRAQGFLPPLPHNATATGYSLWQVEYTGCHSPMGLPGQHGVELDALGSACANTSHSVRTHTLPDGAASVLTLRWDGVAAPHPFDAPFNVTVNITMRAGSAEAALRGSVHKPELGLCVQTMALPNLERMWLRPGPRGEELFVPWFFGHAGDLPDANGLGCGGGDCSIDIRQMSLFGSELPLQPQGSERTMQYGAIYSSATADTASDRPLGIYLGAHSPRSDLMLLLMQGQYPSLYGVRPTPICPYPPCLPTGRAAARWLHVAENLLDGSLTPFEMSYDAVISGFEGDWYDAALIYREWALSSAVWSSRGNLTQRAAAEPEGYPAWLLHTPLWALTPSPPPALAASDVWLQNLLSLKALIGVDHLATHLYNWEREVFDTHYPLAAKDAKDGFGEVVAVLESAGVHTVPYINGRLMDPTLASYAREGAAHACASVSGAPLLERYEQDTAHKAGLVVMDPASKYWQQTVAAAAGSIATQFNTSGIYIDQVAAMYAQPCFRNATQVHSTWAGHNGTAGGGSMWADGYRALLDATAESVGKSRAIFSESNGDAYMGSLHGYMAVYGMRACGFVPAFQAVYSGWSVAIGTFGWPSPERDGQSVRGILAHQFIFGQQLGWTAAETMLAFANSSSINRSFLRSLAQLKVKHVKFLTLGRMLRPPVLLTAGGEPLPLVRMCTTDFAAPETCCNCTAVLGSLWSATDGQLALALTNTADVPISVKATVDTSGAVGSTRHGHGGTKSSMPEVAWTLPPASAVVLPVH
jgi:hypothetical protein